MARTRKNQFDVEWRYALDLWSARAHNKPTPPIPSYSVWEINEGTGKEKLVKQVPCDVMTIRYGEPWTT